MIRHVRLSDAKAIANIYNIYVEESVISFEVEPLTEAAMRERIDAIASEFPYLVWEEQGTILGYCYAHPWKERAAYGRTLETTIYLAPDAKGSGIGTKLMRRLIDECRSVGYRALIACITADNEESVCFHQRLGFQKVSHFKSVGMKFGRWLDVVDYELLLD